MTRKRYRIDSARTTATANPTLVMPVHWWRQTAECLAEIQTAIATALSQANGVVVADHEQVFLTMSPDEEGYALVAVITELIYGAETLRTVRRRYEADPATRPAIIPQR